MSQLDAAAVVRSYCDAWMRGDAMAVLEHYHRDLTLVWPGRHRFAGVHDGQAAAIDALLALQTITNRTPTEIVDVLVGEHCVAVVADERWTVDPDDATAESIEVRRALDYTIVDGKLRTCRVYEADQPIIDDWIARFGGAREA